MGIPIRDEALGAVLLYFTTAVVCTPRSLYRSRRLGWQGRYSSNEARWCFIVGLMASEKVIAILRNSKPLVREILIGKLSRYEDYAE